MSNVRRRLSALGLWRLRIGGTRFLGLIPHDLSYFNRYFVGRPIDIPWVAPPIEVSGKSKKLPDFVGSVLSAPVVSERAKRALEPFIAPYVQFLPFHSIRNKAYHAVNVLAIQHGLLDHSRSTVSRFDDGTIYHIDRAWFHATPTDLPPIFFLGEATGDVWVTDSFAEAVVEHQLTGVQFLAPAQDPLKVVLRREPPNAFPGTPPYDA